MTILRLPVDLGPGVRAWFTGRGDGPDPAVGQAGNLSHRRPHEPARLAADRRVAFDGLDVPPSAVHLMRQVHGRDVAVVTPDTPVGAELVDVDAAVTTVPGRPLAVLVADCVPVLFAGPGAVGVAHAGRRGLAGGVVDAAVSAFSQIGVQPTSLRAAIGPAIGGCCYEVSAELRDEVARAHPSAAAETTWGTPSLDLPAAVATRLERAGVAVQQVGACTRCQSEHFFSHRADPQSGRQAGVVEVQP